MFNLLSPEEKKRIRQVYILRFAVVTAIFSLLILLILISLLAPAFYLARSRRVDLAFTEFLIKGSPVFKEGEHLTALFASSRETLSFINSHNSQRPAADVISRIVGKAPQTIRITGIRFSRSDGDEIFVVSGVASDRDSLLVFNKALSAAGIFKTVELPISNFTKEANIDFSIILKGIPTPSSS